MGQLTRNQHIYRPSCLLPPLSLGSSHSATRTGHASSVLHSCTIQCEICLRYFLFLFSMLVKSNWTLQRCQRLLYSDLLLPFLLPPYQKIFFLIVVPQDKMATKALFKKCSRCIKMPTSDTHDLCLICLGETHNVGTCQVCQKFPQKSQSRQSHKT